MKLNAWLLAVAIALVALPLVLSASAGCRTTAGFKDGNGPVPPWLSVATQSSPRHDGNGPVPPWLLGA